MKVLDALPGSVQWPLTPKDHKKGSKVHYGEQCAGCGRWCDALSLMLHGIDGGGRYHPHFCTLKCAEDYDRRK